MMRLISIVLVSLTVFSAGQALGQCAGGVCQRPLVERRVERETQVTREGGAACEQRAVVRHRGRIVERNACHLRRR